MNLEDIQDRSRVFVDGNVILCALDHKSASCRRFLIRCQTRDIQGVITAITVAEVAHRRMIEEACANGLTGPNPARALARRPELARQLRLYAEDVRDLLAGDLTIESVRIDDFYVALELQNRHRLLTNDSLNLAVAKRLAISEIATADSNFDQVKGIMVYKPDDVAAPK